MDQQADAGHHEEHHRGERIEREGHLGAEGARLDPGVEVIDQQARLGRQREQPSRPTASASAKEIATEPHPTSAMSPSPRLFQRRPSSPFRIAPASGAATIQRMMSREAPCSMIRPGPPGPRGPAAG